MFDKLFGRKPAADAADADPAAQMRLAAAALMVAAARADETYTDKERTLIETALASRFALGPAAARALREAAEAQQAAANDLHRFTKTVKTMPYEDRVGLVETLWRIVLSDDRRDPFEDTYIRRLCGLLYVDDVDSGRARLRAGASD